VALGSQAWVEEVFERNRERRARELKTPGLEAWRGVAWWIYEAAWNSALRERHTASSSSRTHADINFLTEIISVPIFSC
jgi:hypothetical protein